MQVGQYTVHLFIFNFALVNCKHGRKWTLVHFKHGRNWTLACFKPGGDGTPELDLRELLRSYWPQTTWACCRRGWGDVHQVLRGMLAGLAEMHVSPVSMLQCTLMASSALPWFGSTQNSPAKHHQSTASKRRSSVDVRSSQYGTSRVTRPAVCAETAPYFTSFSRVNSF